MMGHTVNLTLAALVWSQYTKYRVVSLFAWLVSLAGMLTLIVNRSHYTIDIIISMFISIFVWKYYHMVLTLSASSQKNRIVMWLEKLDFGAAAEDRHEEGRDGMELGLTSLSLSESLGSSPGPSKYKELICMIK